MNTIEIRNTLLAAAAACLVLLPFIAKPFNVDDPFYIRMAQQIIADPLHPYSFDINWSGELRPVWGKMEATFPPLIPYFIALLIKIFGLHEVPLHAAFLVFPAICGAMMYLLARRSVNQPFVGVLLFLATPVFMTSATGLMLDVPLLAVSLSAMVLLLYGIDERDHRLLTGAAVMMSTALLIKYSGLMLLPLAAFAIVRRRRWHYLFYLLLPLAVFAIWNAATSAIYGAGHFFAAAAHVGKGISLHKSIAFFSFFGGCLVFPVCLTAFSPLSAGLLFAGLFVVGFTLLQKTAAAVLFAAFAAGAAAFLVRLLWRMRDEDPVMVAWFLLACAMAYLLEPWISARYLLVALPPAVILAVGRMEQHAAGRSAMAVVVCVTLLAGYAVAVADHRWACSYRDIASAVGSKGYANARFTGHFGFQYYLEREGAAALEVQTASLDRPYLISARFCDIQRPTPSLIKKVRPLARVQPAEWYPVRVMNYGAFAGFYSSFWGILPWSVSLQPLEEFGVYAALVAPAGK